MQMQVNELVLAHEDSTWLLAFSGSNLFYWLEGFAQ
jgi:hypothetical protein